MRTVALLAVTSLFVGLGALPAAGDAKDEAIKKGRKELEGTWQSVTYALDGKKATAEDLKKIKLRFEPDGKATALRDGKPFIVSATKIDPGKSPKTIDVTFTAGQGKGKTSLGIYKIEGDPLTICRAAPGEARPKELASRPGSGHTLMSYRRTRE